MNATPRAQCETPSLAEVRRMIARAQSCGGPFLEPLWRLVEPHVPADIRALVLQALERCTAPVAP